MKFSYLLAISVLSASLAFAADPPTAPKVRGATLPTKSISDADIGPNTAITFSKDTVYILRNKVFIEEGSVLTIQPGTVIKGDNGTGEASTALIICMGAKIIAQGTAEAPIVMTSIMDDLAGSMTSNDKNGWGGLVILGKATTNNGAAGFKVEGIAGNDPRIYGGVYTGSSGIDDDSSGVLRYLSIRHAGIEIAANNELNSLSMVGVGNKTVVEYVEAFACGDDGIEIWGGTVNGKHLVVAFADDDCFDMDLGYKGNMQFIFSIQDSILQNMKANWAGEWDGDDVAGGAPFAQWSIANATFIGGGSTANTSNSGIILRANGAAHVYNSVLTNFRQNRGIVIEDVTDPAVQDSRKRLEDGHISFKGCILWNVGGATVLDSVARWFKKTENQYVVSPELKDSLVTWRTVYENPMVSSIAYSMDEKKLDPRLLRTVGGAVQIGYKDLATLPSNNFFQTVDYKGAFGEVNWAKGWTALDEYGYFGDLNDDKIVTQIRKNQTPVSRAALRASVNRNLLSATMPVAASGKMRVTLRDSRGRVVARTAARVESGSHAVNMDVSKLANGHYTLEASVGGEVSRTQISIVR